jgi:GNAT superfamily N-acetyltransferase
MTATTKENAVNYNTPRHNNNNKGRIIPALFWILLRLDVSSAFGSCYCKVDGNLLTGATTTARWSHPHCTSPTPKHKSITTKKETTTTTARSISSSFCFTTATTPTTPAAATRRRKRNGSRWGLLSSHHRTTTAVAGMMTDGADCAAFADDAEDEDNGGDPPSTESRATTTGMVLEEPQQQHTDCGSAADAAPPIDKEEKESGPVGGMDHGRSEEETKQATPPPRIVGNEKNYRIRDCTQAELGVCADLILSSFYGTTNSAAGNNSTNVTPKKQTASTMVTTALQEPWRQLYRMAELNRIQQGYPFGDENKKLHRMLVVAVPVQGDDLSGGGRWSSASAAKEERIVGFVDIDVRPPTNRYSGYSYNPRPYLSDLCIHPDYRRQGLGKALVRACEEFCCTTARPPQNRLPLTEQWDASNGISDVNDLQSNNSNTSAKTKINMEHYSELYIRVEAHNMDAIHMYQSMGYQVLPDNPDCRDGAIFILRKRLRHRRTY